MKFTSSTKENRSADWAFNFRSSHFDADTDSDSEEPATAEEHESEESKLAKDLDISERQEAAVYKPNPFSIAKINAAARACTTQVDKPSTRPQPVIARDASKSKAQFTIVDGFKKQAQKAQSAVKGIAPASRLVPMQPAPKPVHASNQQGKPFFATLPPHSGEKTRTSGRSSTPNAAAFPRSSGRPSGLPDPIHQRRTVAPDPSASLTLGDSSNNLSSRYVPGVSKNAHISPSDTHVCPRPQTPPLVTFPSRPPQYAYLTTASSPDNAQGPFKTYGASASSKLTASTSPFQAPAAESHSALQYYEYDDISHCPSYFQDRNHRSSPNLHSRDTPNHRDGRTIDSQGVVFNSLGSGLMPSSTAHHLAKDEIIDDYVYRDPQGIPARLIPVDMINEPSLSSLYPNAVNELRFTQAGGGLRPSSTTYRPVKDEIIEDHVSRNPTEIPGRLIPVDMINESSLSLLYSKAENKSHFIRGITRSPTGAPIAQSIHARPSKIAPHCSIGLGEQRSPYSSTRPRKIPIGNAKKRPRKDAYDLWVVDPDEEWSTLPSRKKFKPSLPATSKTTKPFRLPGLSMPDKYSIKPSGISATSSSRKITYLPPPLLHAGHIDSAQKNYGSNTPTRRSQNLKTRSFPSDAYPSPTRTMSSPLSKNISSPHSNMAEDVHDLYHPMSPPTSDLPAPPDEKEILLDVKSDDIQGRYPGIRAFINEVRRLPLHG